MAKTLVGVFDHRSSAEKAVEELASAGIPKINVRMFDSSQTTATGAERDDRSWTDKVSDWFRSLSEEHEDRRFADDYAEAWRRGHYVVVADVADAQVDPAVRIMNKHGTVDLSRRAEHWKTTGYAGQYDTSAKPYTAEERQRELSSYSKAATQASTTMPVVQEELAVGKRVVQRGGVRIHSYVTERPVEEMVRLREEKIDVERRPVDRPVRAGEGAFEERTVEVKATGEEPVVEKRARVVEEVVVGKSPQEKQETVKETVRRKDVRVEKDEARQGPTSKPAHR